MKAKLSRWGNSLGVRIPAKIAQELGWTGGSEIELALERGGLLLKPSRARIYSLEGLLSGLRPEDIPKP